MRTYDDPAADQPVRDADEWPHPTGSFVVRDLEEYERIVALLHEDRPRAA